jgi:uncharacterized membrane protein YebE (DUF533 family)
MASKSAKSVVISAKVTPDVANAIKGQAKKSGKSVSALISDYAGGVDRKALGGVVIPSNTQEEIVKVATTIGGSALVGILSYKAIKGALEDSKRNGKIEYTDRQIEGIAMLFGVCGAVVTGIGILQLFNED